MRKKILCLFFTLFYLLTSAPAFALDTNNFYFDSFDADYYLSKNEKGIATLKVIETLTAIFPDHDQNHGITRDIPFTNQNGKNLTAENFSALNFSVTRNGKPEPFSITTANDYFSVRIGSADSYVHGRQTYVLTYEFTNVITDFKTFQELYWDTNGTGWTQSFNFLSARIHFSETIQDYWTKNSWCYVGAYGSNDQTRCETNLLSDGIEFKTKNLAKNENLTFDLEFSPNSFVIKNTNFKKILLTSGLILLAFAPLCVHLTYIFKFHKASKNARAALNHFSLTPQYTPPSALKVADASELFFYTKFLHLDKSKVATLIELAVNHKIQLVKTSKKHDWQIKILNLNNLKHDETCLLKILNNNRELSTSEKITLKVHEYNQNLVKLNKEYDQDIKNHLKSSSLISNQKNFFKNSILWIILASFAGFFVCAFCISVSSPYIYNEIVIAASTIFYIALFPLTFFTVIYRYISKKYLELTPSGIDTIKYLRGLKYYMTLAEAERLKFLQSADNIDTSPEGIVNLYEKLLPYAIIFGLETTWLAELNHYYETMSDENRWYYGVTYFSTADFHSFSASATSSISSDTSSSSSSSSSGFSGGGGGGFSGGGGGGGGGGGW